MMASLSLAEKADHLDFLEYELAVSTTYERSIRLKHPDMKATEWAALNPFPAHNLRAAARRLGYLA